MIAGIIIFIIICKLFATIIRGVLSGIGSVAINKRKRAARRDIERKAAEVEKQLARVEHDLKQPIQYHITIDGTDIPIKNAMHLSNKEFIEQEKRIAIVEKAARDKEKFEWQREKMEWARQREAERKQEAERKRTEREQTARDKAAREADEKRLKKRLADRDAIHSTEMVNDVYGAIYREIEQLKQDATTPKRKIQLLNSQAAILNRIHREQQNIEKAKYTKYSCGV